MLQYFGKENEDLEGTVNRNIQALIKLIRDKYLSTYSEHKPMDFGRKYSISLSISSQTLRIESHLDIWQLIQICTVISALLSRFLLQL
jgi:hypothetical protein